MTILRFFIAIVFYMKVQPTSVQLEFHIDIKNICKIDTFNMARFSIYRQSLWFSGLHQKLTLTTAVAVIVKLVIKNSGPLNDFIFDFVIRKIRSKYTFTTQNRYEQRSHFFSIFQIEMISCPICALVFRDFKRFISCPQIYLRITLTRHYTNRLKLRIKILMLALFVPHLNHI